MPPGIYSRSGRLSETDCCDCWKKKHLVNDRTEVYLSKHCRNDRHNCWRVVSIWLQQLLNIFISSNCSDHSDHMDQPLVSLGKFNVHLNVLLPLTITYKLIKQIISKYRPQLFTLQPEVSCRVAVIRFSVDVLGKCVNILFITAPTHNPLTGYLHIQN